MEERFNKKFPDGIYGAEWYSDGAFKCCWGQTEDVKDFILSEKSLWQKEQNADNPQSGWINSFPLDTFHGETKLQLVDLVKEIELKAYRDGRAFLGEEKRKAHQKGFEEGVKKGHSDKSMYQIGFKEAEDQFTLKYKKEIVTTLEGMKWDRKIDAFEHIAEVSYNRAISDIIKIINS